MKFNVLKAGLQMIIDSTDSSAADKQQARQAICELTEITQRLGSYNDIWQDDCYIISADTADDIVNMLTYDEYAKLYKANYRHEVMFNDYEQAARSRCGLEFAALSMLQHGYDVVSSLYADNEANGCHE